MSELNTNSSGAAHSMTSNEIAQLAEDYETLRVQKGVSGRFGLRALVPASLQVGVITGLKVCDIYKTIAGFAPDQGWMMIHGAKSRVVKFAGGALPDCALEAGEAAHYGEVLLGDGTALHFRRSGAGNADGCIWAYALGGAGVPTGFEAVGETLSGLVAQETYIGNEAKSKSGSKIAYRLFYQGTAANSTAGPAMPPRATIFAGFAS